MIGFQRGLGPIGIALLAVSATAGQESTPQEAPARRSDLLPTLDEVVARHDCLACHDPDSALRERLDPVLAPDIRGVTERVERDWLLAFLADPRSVRPDTVHPHQLAGLPESNRAAFAAGIVQFLDSLDRADTDADPAEVEGAAPVEDAFETSDVGELERGRRLFHRIGCVACHGPLESALDLELSLVELEEVELVEDDDEAPVPVQAGILEPDPHTLPPDLTQKYRISTLASFLVDPVAVRPSGHCPSMGLAAPEARAVAAYLLRDQARGRSGSVDRQPGLLLQAYEFGDTPPSLDALGGLEPLAARVVNEIGVDERPADDRFGLRFSGFVEVPQDGTYTFHLRSDDGSRLRVGSELVVDNGGVHPALTGSGSIELYEGSVPIELTYFEAGGGEELSLEWEGPELERTAPSGFSHWALEYRVAPVSLDAFAAGGRETAPRADAVERGRPAFVGAGCANCHAGIVEQRNADVRATVPSLGDLSGARPGVVACLRPDGRYDFDPEVGGRLLAMFVRPGAIAADATDPERLVERRLAGRRCYSCHRRDGVGGVHPDLGPYYEGDEDAELGDQGRFPPTLSAVGRKFRPEVLRAALRGEERVRPYLWTRMPQMGAENTAGLAELLETVDLARRGAAGPEDCGFETIDAGRRLAGDRGGLGCVQCHSFLGTKSLGIQAVDLGQMHRRLRFGWFRELLLDPSNVDLDARMANLWIDGASPVTDLSGGDVDAQIEALWCWLGEGDAMAPPPGLDFGPWAYEIVPSERSRSVAVFMQDVSPRVLCTGTPSGVHYAFDEQNVRLAKVWRGRFLNVEGTWRGRAGQLESPGSSDVLELAPGHPVLPLSSLYGPWPDGAAADVRLRGRTSHPDGSMTFLYAVDGVDVEETVAPISIDVPAGPSGGTREARGVERRFVVRAGRGVPGRSIVARVGVARQVERVGPGRWWLDGKDGSFLEVDRDSARFARLVSPRLREDEPFGADDESRPLVDGRDREVSSKEDSRPSRTPEELRIPITLAPDETDSGQLVGTLTWRIAW